MQGSKDVTRFGMGGLGSSHKPKGGVLPYSVGSGKQGKAGADLVAEMLDEELDSKKSSNRAYRREVLICRWPVQ